MSAFTDQMTADLDIFFNTDEFAETVTYNDGITQTDVPAIVTHGDDGQKHQGEHATIQVKKSDVPAPAYKHTFTIGSTVYRINRDSDQPITSLDALVWEIRITANERAQSWRT